jgi:hypothetical protein
LKLSLRALGGMLGEQWERDRRETLFLMGAILLAVLPQLPHLPWWTSAGFGILFLWRFGLVMSGRWLPRDSVRWVASIACGAAVFAHYGTLLGREPGVALLVLFLGLKLMEMRARRDLFVVIFLCFFLLLTSFFHSQSMLTAALAGVAVLALLTAMLTMQFGTREQPVARRFRTAGTILLQAAPIAILFFVLFPRVQGPLWGLPDDAHTGGTGLSESMSPGQISSLSRSDALAFRVLFDGDAPAPAQMYWRGGVRRIRWPDLEAAGAAVGADAAGQRAGGSGLDAALHGDAGSEQPALAVRAGGAGARGRTAQRRRAADAGHAADGALAGHAAPALSARKPDRLPVRAERNARDPGQLAAPAREVKPQDD